MPALVAFLFARLQYHAKMPVAFEIAFFDRIGVFEALLSELASQFVLGHKFFLKVLFYKFAVLDQKQRRWFQDPANDH